jgi:hypothetical protein
MPYLTALPSDQHDAFSRAVQQRMAGLLWIPPSVTVILATCAPVPLR